MQPIRLVCNRIGRIDRVSGRESAAPVGVVLAGA
jgi:hypothetical protein